MTPAQTYAAGFARWRARMPRHMQVGRSMDRMFDCTDGERVQTRRRRWR